MNNIVALSIEYWTINYEIKSLHNLKRLIQFYKSILDKGVRDLEYSERHHMIPDCMNICNVSDEHNLIVMTAREHFIAHQILSRIFKDNTKEYHQMNLAIFRMCHSNDDMGRQNHLIISSRLYEKLKLKYSEAISYSNRTRKLPDDYMKGSRNTCYGKKLYHKDNEQKYLLPEQIEEYESNGWIKGGLKFTKEHRERISKSLTGHKASEQARENMSRAQSNKRCINNGKYNKTINSSELDKYLSEGWRLGRIIYSKSKE